MQNGLGQEYSRNYEQDSLTELTEKYARGMSSAQSHNSYKTSQQAMNSTHAQHPAQHNYQHVPSYSSQHQYPQQSSVPARPRPKTLEHKLPWGETPIQQQQAPVNHSQYTQQSSYAPHSSSTRPQQAPQQQQPAESNYHQPRVSSSGISKRRFNPNDENSTPSMTTSAPMNAFTLLNQKMRLKSQTAASSAPQRSHSAGTSTRVIAPQRLHNNIANTPINQQQQQQQSRPVSSTRPMMTTSNSSPALQQESEVVRSDYLKPRTAALSQPQSQPLSARPTSSRQNQQMSASTAQPQQPQRAAPQPAFLRQQQEIQQRQMSMMNNANNSSHYNDSYKSHPSSATSRQQQPPSKPQQQQQPQQRQQQHYSYSNDNDDDDDDDVDNFNNENDDYNEDNNDEDEDTYGRSGGFGNAQPSEPSAEPPEDLELARCQYCDRKFAVDRLEKHTAVCLKSKNKVRKQFNSAAKRQLPEATNVAKTAEPTKPTNKKPKWKIQREQFRAAMQSIKNEPVDEVTDDRIECPHCERKFNEEAAKRHIPRCKQIIGKPTVLKKGGGNAAGQSAAAIRNQVSSGAVSRPAMASSSQPSRIGNSVARGPSTNNAGFASSSSNNASGGYQQRSTASGSAGGQRPMASQPQSSRIGSGGIRRPY